MVKTLTIGQQLKGCELADRAGLTDWRWHRYAWMTAVYIAAAEELRQEEQQMKELMR